jgi:hypothetical protein
VGTTTGGDEILVERPKQCWTMADDLFEVVLGEQFLPQVDVFRLQSCLQVGNFLVRPHILNGQRYLVSHALQEHGVLFRILVNDVFEKTNKTRIANPGGVVGEGRVLCA